MMGGMGGGMGMEARVTSDDIGKIVKVVGLSPDQAEAAKALFEGYLAAHNAKAAEAREAMEKAREEFRESRDPSVFESMGEKMQALRKATIEAEKALMADIKSLLNDDQAARWPAFERSQRRETTLSRGFISVSGERADVIRIVEGLKLTDDQKAPLATILAQYEEELDPALVRRNQLQEASEGQGMRFMRAFRPGGAPDDAEMKELEKTVTENREAMMKVRDINRRYAAQVQAALPADQAERFQAAFKRESFPQIYRERNGSRTLAAAEKIDDLSPEQKAALTAIRESYTRDAAALAARAEAAQEEEEKNFSLRTMMQRGFGGGGNENDPMREIGRSRSQLEDATADKVRDLLNPDQRAKLPERNADGGGRRGPGNEMDNNRNNRQNQPRRQRPGDQAPPPPGN